MTPPSWRIVSSLVSWPHPFTRRNGLVNQVEVVYQISFAQYQTSCWYRVANQISFTQYQTSCWHRVANQISFTQYQTSCWYRVGYQMSLAWQHPIDLPTQFVQRKRSKKPCYVQPKHSYSSSLIKPIKPYSALALCYTAHYAERIVSCTCVPLLHQQ